MTRVAAAAARRCSIRTRIRSFTAQNWVIFVPEKCRKWTVFPILARRRHRRKPLCRKALRAFPSSAKWTPPTPIAREARKIGQSRRCARWRLAGGTAVEERHPGAWRGGLSGVPHVAIRPEPDPSEQPGVFLSSRRSRQHYSARRSQGGFVGSGTSSSHIRFPLLHIGRLRNANRTLLMHRTPSIAVPDVFVRVRHQFEQNARAFAKCRDLALSQ